MPIDGTNVLPNRRQDSPTPAAAVHREDHSGTFAAFVATDELPVPTVMQSVRHLTF